MPDKKNHSKTKRLPKGAHIRGLKQAVRKAVSIDNPQSSPNKQVSAK